MVDVHKVLIVDTSSETCFLLAQYLTQAGYQVVIATSGNEGYAQALQAIPHCILLDIFLPDITGFEVCRRLRLKDPYHQHRIVLMGHENMPLEHKWGWQQGADYYLSKPFSPETLIQVLRHVLSPQFRPPADIQQFIAGVPPEPAVRPKSEDWTLWIPVRKEEPELLTTSSPFNSSNIIRDTGARRFYEAIDNHANVKQLCNITGMTAGEAYKALQLLLARDRIQLYTSNGKAVDHTLFRNNP